MLSAAIFDLDGLLIDSERLWPKAEQEIFADVGVDLTLEMCSTTRGLRVDEVVAHWHSVYPWTKTSQAEVTERIVDRVAELVGEEGEPLEGVDHALSFFAGMSWPIAICSSSPTKVIDAALDRLAIRERFDVIRSAEGEALGKPHPGSYLATAKDLLVEPTSCLAFEDSFYGAIAAKAARMCVVVIPDPAQAASTLWDFCDARLASLEEVGPELIGLLQDHSC